MTDSVRRGRVNDWRARKQRPTGRDDELLSLKLQVLESLTHVDLEVGVDTSDYDRDTLSTRAHALSSYRTSDWPFE